MRYQEGRMNWWQKIIEMVAATACVVAVLLVSAKNPGADEFTRGVPAAILAYLAAKITGRQLRG